MAAQVLFAMLEIFWAAGSPFAWRVLLAAELKRVPYESRLLEFSKGDLKKSDFLALNPRGKVPVIRDGDVVLAESLAIIAYLERKYPDPPLLGKTPEETGRIWTAISTFESYVRDVTTPLNRWLFGDKPRTAEIDEARAQVGRELDTVEARLADHSWLAGDTVTAADVVWFPTLRAYIRAAARNEARAREVGLHPLADVYPNIARWIVRIEAQPGYDRTFPPHWK
jgi:glutathione S-transferase